MNDFLQKLENAYINNIESDLFRFKYTYDNMQVLYYVSPSIITVNLHIHKKINNGKVYIQSIGNQIYDKTFVVIFNTSNPMTGLSTVTLLNEKALSLDDYMIIAKINAYFSYILKDINVFNKKYNIKVD